MKDDMRDLAANLYGVIVCNQSHDERIREALDDFYSALSDKVIYNVILCNQSHDERIREALDDFYSALSDKVIDMV